MAVTWRLTGGCMWVCSHRWVCFRNGELMSGVIDKSIIGEVATRDGHTAVTRPLEDGHTAVNTAATRRLQRVATAAHMVVT